jgi:hypothetical protein
MDYYANVGPDRGTALYRDTPPATDVLDSRGGKLAIGSASEAGWTEYGVALWRLKVNGAEINGRWAIVDRRFVPQFQSNRDADRA